jgi:HEAT repeat protein
LSEAHTKKLLELVEMLNCFSLQPVKSVSCVKDGGGEYYPVQHEVAIPRCASASAMPALDYTMAVLAHEMGHSIYAKVFDDDRDWTIVYNLLLGWKNSRIVDEYSYGAGDGHPYSNPTEAFASSVHTYVLFANKFASYIQNMQTPERMRTAGKLVWCFMRERVFRGSVFTNDGRDPFADESFESLFKVLSPLRIKGLFQALTDAGPEIRRAAAEALQFARMTEEEENEAPAHLLPLLHDSFSSVRSAVAKTLGEYRNASKQTVLALVEALGDPDEEVRLQVAGSLITFKEHHDIIIPKLIVVLRDPSWKVRVRAAYALGKFGEAERSALPHLQEALKDTDPDVRKTAGEAIALLCENKNNQCDNLLDDLVTHNDPRVRAGGIVALGKLSSNPFLYRRNWNDLDIVMPLLKSLIEDDDVVVRRHAAQALGDCDPFPEVLTALTQALLKDSDTRVRRLSAVALAYRFERSAVAAIARPLVIDAVDDSDRDVRLRAIEALGRIGPPADDDSITALLRAVSDTDAEIRSVAVQVLGVLQLHRTDVLAAFMRALRDHDRNVRRATSSSLGKLGSFAEPAAFDLLRLAHSDPDELVRWMAAWAFRQIKPFSICRLPVYLGLQQFPVPSFLKDALVSIASAFACPDND